MKFLLTRELGKLATWLRIMGFNSEYFREQNMSSLVIQALRDDRIILTRNQHLSRHTGLKIIFINSEQVKEQLVEVLKALNIKVNKDIMFSRCVICNELLLSVDKEKVKTKIPEYVFSTQDNFTQCPRCSRVYWQGTHWGKVQDMLNGIYR